MRFYNREKELASLEKVRQVSFSVHSQMTVLTGRRRIGKTSLIFKSCEDTPTVYLFVSRSNETALCLRFVSEIRQALNIYVPELTNFAEVFRFLMDLGTRMAYNLVIDEFQEFYYINQEIYSLMQDTWDRLRKQSHVNLIVSGSVYTLMNKIFRDSKGPLYGRADSIMKLAPFTTSVLKEIMSEHKADYSKDDLLALYTFTGGVPKYIEQFMDNGCTSMESMVDFMLQPDSSFLTEGQALLIQEFGKKYGNYFSILSAVSNGKNTLPEMETVMGGMSLGGQLKRLEEDYDLIKKKRPILSKEGSQTVRYEVSDMFLRFWFRYFIKYQNYIEIQNFECLADIIKKENPDLIINLGDTFDQHTITSYDIDVASKFFKCFEQFDIPHFVLVGNHEMVNQNFNAIEILNNITVISEPTTIDVNDLLNVNEKLKLGFLPYCNYKDIIMFPEASYLFSHQDIQGATIRGDFKLPDGIEPNTLKDKYKLVFNGHIHKSSILCNVINVGSITTHSFSDDENSIPQCYIFDTITNDLKIFKSTVCPLFRKFTIQKDINELYTYINSLDTQYKYILHIICPFEIKEDVKKYNLNDTLMVEIGSTKKSILYGVHLKISPGSKMEMHIDTDDANGNFIKTGDEGEIK